MAVSNVSPFSPVRTRTDRLGQRAVARAAEIEDRGCGAGTAAEALCWPLSGATVFLATEAANGIKGLTGRLNATQALPELAARQLHHLGGLDAIGS
jgi:hypothetical protein